jgi:hypothetical protein
MIKKMIDTIIDQRSKGNPSVVGLTRTKLILKGIDPAKFTATSADDPAIIAQVKHIAVELNVKL